MNINSALLFFLNTSFLANSQLVHYNASMTWCSHWYSESVMCWCMSIFTSRSSEVFSVLLQQWRVSIPYLKFGSNILCSFMYIVLMHKRCVYSHMYVRVFFVCVYKKKRTTKFIDNWIEHSTVEWGHPDQKYICQMLSLISESQLWIFRYVCSFGISVEVMKLIRAHWVGRDKHIGI